MSMCPICDSSFDKKVWNQKFCSNKCKRSIRTNCSQCEKEIVRYKGKREHYYCDSICAGLHTGRTVKRKCLYCNEEFLSIRSSVSYGWGNYCTNACHYKSMTKESAVGMCKQCFKVFDIKHKNAQYCSKNCSDEAYRKPIPVEILRDMYIEQELTARHIAHVIGRNKKVVLDYLHHYGIEVRPNGLMNRELIKCNDGHQVRSYYERAFDNYLYKEGLPHEHDVRLPFDKRYMADFLVEDVYIEIWGMMSIESYRERREKKIKLYKDNNCKLLEIYPNDFKNLGSKMNQLKHLIL